MKKFLDNLATIVVYGTLSAIGLFLIGGFLFVLTDLFGIKFILFFILFILLYTWAVIRIV